MLTEQKRSGGIAVTLRSVIIIFSTLIFSFFMGRVSIIEEMYPFAPALLICSFDAKNSVNPFIVMGGVYASLCSVIPSLSFPQYNFCVISILSVSLMIIHFLKLEKAKIFSYFAAAGAFIISAAIFRRDALLQLAYCLGELALCLLFSGIISITFGLIFARKKRTVLDEAELLSIIFCAVICLAGIGDVSVIGIHLINIVSCTICIFAAYCGGSKTGSLAAAFTSFSCLIGGEVSMEACIALIISSAISGTFNKVIRPLFAAIFFACCTICSSLISFRPEAIAEFAIGSILFCLIPQRLFSSASSALSLAESRKKSFSLMQKRFEKATSGEIRQISKALSGAARSLKVSAEARKQTGMQYAIANIPEQCCDKCPNYALCWDEQFDITYSFMQHMYDRYKLAGKLTEKDIMRDYESRCCKQKKLLFTLNSVFNEYSIKAHWENKVMESRSVLSEQLNGVASALYRLDERILTEMRPDDRLEEDILISLDKLGCYVKEISVTQRDNEPTIDLKLHSCGGCGKCRTSIKKVISNICERPMQLDKEPLCGTSLCNLSYRPADNIALKTAVSRATKDGSTVSGDTYSLKPLPDGRYMLLICDGMGSGERAQKESFAAANLIEDYYSAGFDSKSILNMINKLMLLSSCDEVFSALDLCVVDLKKANAHFTKIGAPHSYIIGKDKIRRLSGGALPLGILEDCEPLEHTCPLSPGDLIVIFSDGISEAELKDGSLYNKITGAAPSDNVKVIADRIISCALSSTGGKAEDDLTVIVSRVTAA